MTNTTETQPTLADNCGELFRRRRDSLHEAKKKFRKAKKSLNSATQRVKIAKRVLPNIRRQRAYDDQTNRNMALMDGGSDDSYSNPKFYRILHEDPVYQKLDKGFLGYGVTPTASCSADRDLQLMIRYRKMPEDLYRAIELGDVEKTKELYGKLIESFGEFCIKNVWWHTFEGDLEEQE